MSWISIAIGAGVVLASLGGLTITALLRDLARGLCEDAGELWTSAPQPE